MPMLACLHAFLSSLTLLQGAYDTLVNAGITFFDTSDVYGYKSYKQGFSAEQLLGRFAEENVRPFFIRCFVFVSRLLQTTAASVPFQDRIRITELDFVEYREAAKLASKLD